jgi:hypothetical protein
MKIGDTAGLHIHHEVSIRHDRSRKDESLSNTRFSAFKEPIWLSSVHAFPAVSAQIFFPCKVKSGYNVARPPPVMKVMSAEVFPQTMVLKGPVTVA